MNHSWLMQVSRVIIELYYCDAPSAEGNGIGAILTSLPCVVDIEHLLRIELYPFITSGSPSVCSICSP